MTHYNSIEDAPELPSKGDGYTFDAKGHQFHARWVEPGRWSVVIGHGDEFMAHVSESNEGYIVNQIAPFADSAAGIPDWRAALTRFP